MDPRKDWAFVAFFLISGRCIQETLRFTKDRFGIEMDADPGKVRCEFHHLNKECKRAECGFYPS